MATKLGRRAKLQLNPTREFLCSFVRGLAIDEVDRLPGERLPRYLPPGPAAWTFGVAGG